jgi:NADH-quinone oxidoreductase subunit C
MKQPKEIFESLKEKFTEYNFEIIEDLPVEPIISVDPLNVNKIGFYLRLDADLQFDSLMVLSGVDDNNAKKIKQEDETEIDDPGTLSVYYHLYSTTHKHKVTLKASAPKDNPEIESVEKVWKTADWHEREAYDMIGIKFLNHPDLRRILMPYDWDENSFPLRKDYENPEFYQGIKVPY